MWNYMSAMRIQESKQFYDTLFELNILNSTHILHFTPGLMLTVPSDSLVMRPCYFLWILQHFHVHLPQLRLIIPYVKFIMSFILIGNFFMRMIFKLYCLKWKLRQFLLWILNWNCSRNWAHCFVGSISLWLYLIWR